MGFTDMKKPTIGTMAGDITKDDLIDQVVAFELIDTDDAFETKHGTSFKAAVNLIVCTGDRTGEIHADWWVFGNLAKQMAGAVENVAGAATVARVVKGPNFYGLDACSDKEFAAAEKLAASLDGGESKKQSDKAPF